MGDRTLKFMLAEGVQAMRRGPSMARPWGAMLWNVLHEYGYEAEAKAVEEWLRGGPLQPAEDALLALEARL